MSHKGQPRPYPGEQFLEGAAKPGGIREQNTSAEQRTPSGGGKGEYDGNWNSKEFNSREKKHVDNMANALQV